MDVCEAVEKLTRRRAGSAHAIGGSVFQVTTDGGELVAKRYGAAGEVQAEVASLRWLAAARAVPVPKVLACNESWLVTEYVPSGTPSAGAAEELGRRLAALHSSGAPAFEKAIDRIDTLAGPTEPPARLHGDLWSGNVFWSADGQAWLIDPAAHGGHRETDLAMLRLFGCPHLDRILSAYQECSPLAEGWQQRVPLHQLFPLLVHAVLFGGGYGAQAATAALAALAA